MSPQLLQLLLQQGIGMQDLGEPREPSMYDDDAEVKPLGCYQFDAGKTQGFERLDWVF